MTHHALILCATLAVTVSPRDEQSTAATPLPPAHARHDIEHPSHTMRAVIARSAALKPGQVAPLVLFLHGRGECGTDGTGHLHVGLPPRFRAEPERWPFVLVMPQKPRANAEWEDFEADLLEFIDAAAATHGADPELVFITGLSQGGHGALAMAARHPGRFAAVAAVCPYIGTWNLDGERLPRPAGAGDAALSRMADALAGTPVRLFHGSRDSVTPVSDSRLLRDALEARGADVALTEYPALDHNSWDEAYGSGGIASWFLHLASGDTQE